MRRWIATRLRYLADRIDPKGAPRFTGYHFRFEAKKGIVFDLGPGCGVWYYGEDDYSKAWTEAGWGATLPSPPNDTCEG